VSAEPRRGSVLVCESDLYSVRALKAALRDAGLDVCVTSTAEEALVSAALHMPDAAIIGTLPDASGTEICRQLRRWSSVPIMVLSEVSDEGRVVAAFDAGADDYLTKPVRPRELVARVRSHIRRAAAGQDAPLLLDDGTRIDFAARLLQRDGRQVRLTPIEYRLLASLVRNRGALLIHDSLQRDIWGVAYVGDRQTLRAHVANLRRKLVSLGSTATIRTYAGAGYLFEGPPGRSPGQRPIAKTTPPPRHLRAA
jgi:two-component system, OmpR family, KDP operon response regulator KdpE